VFAQSAPIFVLQRSIDLGAFGFNRPTSIAFDPVSGNLLVALPLSQGNLSSFAEITPTGTLVNVYPSDPSLPPVDNAGLSLNLGTGHLFFVNGLGSVDPELIVEMTTNGTVLNRFDSPIHEGTGLAIDPVTGNLFVSDVEPLPQRVRELSLQGSTFVEVNSFTLPGIFGSTEAGLEFNPITGNLAVAGEGGNNPGVIFDVSRNGTILGAFFDTGLTQGISGITFDIANSTMYVLDPTNKILVFTRRVIPVLIDIEPHSDRNRVNPKSNENISVAVFGTEFFDVTTVNLMTVRFGRTGIEVAQFHSALKDVDRDGIADLILNFKNRNSGIRCGDISASLTGETSSGQKIEGADFINTIGCQ
jgi:DNA-binding beta-propeller fold protein YncE